MPFNCDDRVLIRKFAQAKGYEWNRNFSMLTHNNGGILKFSMTGSSVNLNGTEYTNLLSVLTSSYW